jgi:hypothetical protein
MTFRISILASVSSVTGVAFREGGDGKSGGRRFSHHHLNKPNHPFPKAEE